MSSHPVWTDSEIDILKKMAAAKFRIDEIRKVLKSRSIESIRAKCQKEGISLMAHVPEIDMDLFCKLIKGK